MSSEQNLPEVPAHQGPPPAMSQDDGSNFQAGQSSPHGMGQSKSSRRRRRKRKNKGPETAGEGQGNAPEAGSANGGGGEVPTLTAAASPAPAALPQQSHAPGQSFQASQGQQHGGAGNGQGGTKRWKKKFRDRDRDRPRFTENPGNQAPRESHGGGSNGFSGGGGSFSNNGGTRDAALNRDTSTHQFGNRTDSFKRKGGSSGGGGKQQHRDRGPRTFVGPMDHSYRAVNSDFAEAPPSTIPTQAFVRRGGASFHTGDSQPIDYSQGRSIPIPDDAPTRIYFFIEDLFFLAKINETARKIGVKVVFIKSSDKEAIAALTSAEEDDRPALIVFDLNNANAKPLTLIPKLKNKLKRSTSIIGFLSHIQGDLKAKAVEAGCDTVMARAAFSQNLPNLLRRYGLEEEEENNFNY